MSSNYVPPTSPIGQPPQVHQGYPGQPPQQKSKTWIWILGGCGTIVLLGVIAAAVVGYFAYRKGKEVMSDMEKNPAMAMAKLAVAANPDLETVSIDEAKGTITVKDKKTGKTTTLNFEDLQKDGKFVIKGENGEEVWFNAKGGSNGSFEVKSDKGSVKFGAGSEAENLPDWLPSYPGAKTEGTYSMRGKDGSTGSFSFTTNDSVDHVINFYETELKAAGLKVNTTSWKQSGAPAGGLVSGEDKDKQHVAAVTITTKDNGGTQVNVTFETKD